jgi:GT2 family glycosyltransferase
VFIRGEALAFSPKTFMYFEEYLLAEYAIGKGYKIVYSPEIRVRHMEGKVTSEIYTEEIDKRIFRQQHNMSGEKILFKRLRKK